MNLTRIVGLGIISILALMLGVVLWTVAKAHITPVSWDSLWPLIVMAAAAVLYLTAYKGWAVLIGLAGVACFLAFKIFELDLSTVPVLLASAWRWIRQTWLTITAGESPWVIAAVIIGGATIGVAMWKRARGPSGWAFKLLGSLAFAVAVTGVLSISIFGVDQTTKWLNQARAWVINQDASTVTTAPDGQVGVWYQGSFSARSSFEVKTPRGTSVLGCLIYDEAANRALSGRIPAGEYSLKQGTTNDSVVITAHPVVVEYYSRLGQPVQIKYIRTRTTSTRC